jgi:ABC-type multidrug transport system fused ATPase/permease subunit
MKKNNLIFIKKVFSELDQKRKKELLYLFILISIVTTFELLSVTGLIPILLLLISNEKNPITLNENFKYFEIFTKYLSNIELVLVFIILIGITGYLKLKLFKIQTKLFYNIGNDLSKILINKIFSLQYVNFNKLNSSEIVSLLTVKIDTLITNFFIPLIQIFTNLLILSLILIIIFAFLINSSIIYLSILIITSIYLIIFKYNKVKISKIAMIINNEQSNTIKIIKNNFDCIKELILYNTKEKAINNYINSQEMQRTSIANLSIINGSTKFIIETIFFIILLNLLLYYLIFNKDLSYLILMIGLLTYSLQRSLPLVNQIYAGYVSISGCVDIIIDLCVYLKINIEQPVFLVSNQIIFKNNITLKNISFSYKDKIILNQINLKIKKGSFVAITGKTGSGKSTLMDIILGLLSPKSGEIIIDNKTSPSLINSRSWMNQIAHVAQVPYIYDSSIYENITLNSDINYELYEKAIITTKLRDFINDYEDNLHLRVGENGRNLSGGQKQKIAIARALYRNPSLLLLDEATSALNKEFAIEIINTIKKNYSDITVIHISHSIWHEDQYDCIYRIEKNNLVKQIQNKINE